MNILTEDNFLLFAARFYDNPQCQSTEEFYDDLKRFKYIKRLFNKYLETGELKERLILNHIVVLTNVFTPEAAVKLLFVRLDQYLHLLKPFLVLLQILPERLEINNIVYLSSSIPMDEYVVERLRLI
tara:strand:- start:12600 stop:12980 length:381 start_codon:yes stop_codon:yes gene_type:complete